MEKKVDVKVEEGKSNLSLESRKRLALTGVVEVLSFNEEKILLNTVLGNMVIKGEGLKMNKLDVQNGDVIIAGRISSMVYISKEKIKKKESLLKRIFK